MQLCVHGVRQEFFSSGDLSVRNAIGTLSFIIFSSALVCFLDRY